jgi:glyoxylase-like metal-dependent hydrolase (beta-lactamase superfamily II)
MGARGSATDGIALQRVTQSTVAAIDPRLQSNAAAAVFEGFIVAVDVGMRPYAARLFREALESTYRRPVRFACVTHYHADHAFGLQAFKDVTLFGSRRLAEVLERSPDWSPEACARLKQDDPEGGEWLHEVELVVPSLRFDGRMDIVNKGRSVEFRHAGGHTDCSVYGFLPDEKVLFAGDLIFAGGFPFAGDPTMDPEVWMATLRTWTSMAIEHVIPGHGPVSGPGEIVRQLEFFETLKRNTIEAIEAGRDCEDIVLPSIYPIGDKVWFAEKTVQRWHAYYSGC